ncbi:AAA family ATPase [Actinomadura flavalba]|uniref:AAA family ATPase n=1 Tax=Actinomadura flavalba TaxID=1120938 RepID=UPI00037FD680|nr:helix-turn-helix transcriptional regulator [Actinomadura flavalba]
MLIGRDAEVERVGRLVAAAAEGRSGVLVVRGDAGIGKTALLDRAAEGAGALRTLRVTGIESEAELPFSGLHLLLHPFADRFGALPARQAAALRAAFGLADEAPHDRFLVGAATLTLLSELAGERPLLVLVDDAQWLDQASADALFFAARRLHADPIAMIVAIRDTARPTPAPGLPAVRLGGLARDDAAALLDRRVPGLTAPVRDRLLGDADGNPLALVELGVAARDLPGRPVLAGPPRVTARVQDAFRAQLDALPDATRLVLLVLAADGTGDLGVVLRAAASLGAGAADLGAAAKARLIAPDEARFRHPLIRAVVYQEAPHHLRIAAHDALAAALPGPEHADRRAWHRAAAATGPDERVAAELEQAAGRALRRGGAAAVAAARERAARLSTDPEGRARRTAGAARAAYDAGRPGWALRLAAEAATYTADPLITAETVFLRAQIAYERTSPAADAALALEAAGLALPHDPDRAVAMLTEAIWSARDAGAHDLVRRAVALLPPGTAAVAGLTGYGLLLDGDTAAAVPAMRTLVDAADRTGDVVERVIAGFLALLVADDAAAASVLGGLVADARADGALGWLPYALEPLALALLLRGDLPGAEAVLDEALALADDLGMPTQVVALRGIAAWPAALAGDPAPAEAAVAAAGLHPTNAAVAAWGLGLLDLARGDAAAALDRLDAVCGGPAGHDVLLRAVPDHVEAAVRAGRPDEASRYLPAFERWAAHTGGAAALLARCRALLAGDDAEEHHRAALDDDRAFDAARARLLYGEWLRRRRRRADARAELRRAGEAFARLGASAWAARADTELAALGDRRTAPGTADRLTPQELQVVRLAAAGYSNREIGARLFLSPRTVGHHLYKAFPKVGVTRRAELARLDL